jgi:hypothetical protein
LFGKPMPAALLDFTGADTAHDANTDARQQRRSAKT